jgi:hypothetical protein
MSKPLGTIEEKEDGLHINIDQEAYDEWLKEQKKLDEWFDNMTDEQIDKLWDDLGMKW